MTTQYTPTLKLALPVTGELSGTWGDVVNDNITSMIEQAIAGLSTINTWTANAHTLTTANGTTSESRCAMLVAATGGGAPTAAAEIICPAAAKLYVLQNNTSYAVTLKTSAGTGVAVAAGDTAFLFCDGTNVNSCVTTIVDGNITGNLTVGGNATINGNTTLGNATSDTITATARFASDLVPSTDNARDLGSAANSWRSLWIDGTATMALVAISGGTIDGVSIGSTTAATIINVDNLRLDGNTISSTDTNGNVVIAPNGTGDVQLDADTVRVGDSAAAATLTSNGAGALTVTTGGTADLTLSTNAGVNSGTVVIANGVNGNITLTPNGTGDVILSADRVQMGDSNTDTTLTTNGTGNLNLTTNDGTNSGTIQIAQGINGNITLTPNGTGSVSVPKLVWSNGTTTRVPYLTTGGQFTDSANLTFNGTTLTAGGLTTTGTTSTGVLSVTGNTTLGDAAADTVTVTGTITSNLLFTDATYDIGASGATRPRDLFLSRNLTVGGTLTLTGGVNLNGNVTVGDASTDTLTINSTITSNLIFTDNTYDIGASGATRPRTLYLGTSLITPAVTNSGLTSGRVPYSTTGGLQTDSATFTYNGQQLTSSGSASAAFIGYVATTSAADGYSGIRLINTGASGREYQVGVGGSTSGQNNNWYVYDVTANAARLVIDSSGNLTLGDAAAGTNRQFSINGVVNKAQRIAFQESGSTKWLVGNGAASENGNFEIYDNTNGNNFVFTRTGNLGLGVAPNANAGQRTLSIANYTGTFSSLTMGGNGTAAGYVGYNMGNTSTNTVWRYLTADTGSALWFAGNEMRFMLFPAGSAGATTSGTQAMTLFASGALALGTTTDPTSGHFAIGPDSAKTASSIMWFANTGGRLYVGKESSAGGTIVTGTSAYAAVVATNNTYPLQFGVNNAVKVTIDSTGLVGIGQTSPIAYVDVYGGGAYTYARFWRNDEAGYGGRVGNGNTLLGAAGNRSLGLDGFASINFGIAGSQVALIDSSGALLVGTTTANSAKFAVGTVNDSTGGNQSGWFSGTKNGYASYQALPQGQLAVMDQGTAVGSGGAISFMTPQGAGSTWGGSIQVSKVASGTSDYGCDMLFYTRPTGGVNTTPAVLLTSVGNTRMGLFGNIDTANPERLGVSYTYPQTGMAMQNGSATQTYAILFKNPNGIVGSIQTGGTTTQYITSSDYRLKNTIAPMVGALGKVAQLKPVTYKWNSDGSDGQGFIAHELQEVAPYAVSGEKDGKDMQGVEYGRITPLLTAALQEAIAKIELLEVRLALLESK